MSKGLMVVIGMSIAYLASFLGLALAYVAYKRKTGQKTSAENKDKE